MSGYAVGEDAIEGVPVTVLSAARGYLRAAFAPGTGMIGASLRHRGEEVLGQRGGLAKYAQTGSSMGIPLLYPWANRLSGMEYSVAGREVMLDPERTPLRLDPNGLPIHGLASASPHWEVTETAAGEAGARLCARLDWAAHEELMAGFPFAHEVRVEVTLSGATLAVETLLHATADDPVPVCFGWHPYVTLPGVARGEYDVTLPVRRRAVLDERGLPTGEEVAVREAPGRLGERTYDDLYVELCHPPAFVARGGGRRVEVRFEAGYPYAQVYAPAGQDFVCFEPMTAPTDALTSGAGLQVLAPGERYFARFSITVTDS
ncbi:MAG: aldose 1-epimerase [Actinomycetota bacterium]|nr:aldose 1-epimerase [Actinomycetota bacterium]